MVYNVVVEEIYRYSRRVDCADEAELSRILHEDIPLLVDMTKDDVEKIRKCGLHLKTVFSW